MSNNITKISISDKIKKSIIAYHESTYKGLSKMSQDKYIEDTLSLDRAEGEIALLEKAEINSQEGEPTGILIKTQTVTKKNLGNIRENIEIKIQRSLLAGLFTSTSITPTTVYSEGNTKYYIWEKELLPNEEFSVTLITNWVYLILIIFLIIVLIILIRKQSGTDLILRKKVR